jgi:8-oxo-dGTP diphosphatase
MLRWPGTYLPVGVELSEAGVNPALSRNCDAPLGMSQVACLRRRTQLSTEGRFGSLRGTPPPTNRRWRKLSGKTTHHLGRPISAADTARERVGVGVIVVRDGTVLFGLRRGAHGAGSWSFPGGHVDEGERLEATALRELEEETGLRAPNPRGVGESDDIFSQGLRYRTHFVQVDWIGGEPAVREPDSCDRWGWFAWDDAPEPLFLPVASLRAAGFRP